MALAIRLLPSPPSAHVCVRVCIGADSEAGQTGTFDEDGDELAYGIEWNASTNSATDNYVGFTFYTSCFTVRSSSTSLKMPPYTLN